MGSCAVCHSKENTSTQPTLGSDATTNTLSKEIEVKYNIGPPNGGQLIAKTKLRAAPPTKQETYT
jgi:hypothetical protein